MKLNAHISRHSMLLGHRNYLIPSVSCFRKSVCVFYSSEFFSQRARKESVGCGEGHDCPSECFNLTTDGHILMFSLRVSNENSAFTGKYIYLIKEESKKLYR